MDKTTLIPASKTYHMNQNTLICPECFCAAEVTDKDNAINLARMKEQASFRKVNEPFFMPLQITCSNCGPVTTRQIIKNIKIDPCPQSKDRKSSC
jgi:hypothetical protein